MAMEKATFVVQEDFEALRLNESNHAFFSPFGLFQDASAQFGATYKAHSAGPGYYILVGPASEETVTKNRAPAVMFDSPTKFKQRTFPGKPLSDEQISHANRIADEIEDGLFMQGLRGR